MFINVIFQVDEFPNSYSHKLPERNEKWVISTTIESHKCGNLSWFESFTPTKDANGHDINIYDAKNKNIACGTGTVKFNALTGINRWDNITLNDVEYIPGSPNFVCEYLITELNFQFKDKSEPTRSGRKILLYERHNNEKRLEVRPSKLLYQTTADKSRTIGPKKDISKFLAPNEQWNIWHLRMMHCETNMLYVSNLHFDGPPATSGQISCKSCIDGIIPTCWRPSRELQHRKLTQQPGDEIRGVVYTVPENMVSMTGNRHILMLVDSCTSYTWVYPLQTASDAGQMGIQFIEKWQTEFKNKYTINCIYIRPPTHKAKDKFRQACERYHINLRNICKTNEDIYKAKLINNLNKTTTFLKFVGLSENLWDKTMESVVFLENTHVPVGSGTDKSKYFELYGENAPGSRLIIPGSPSWAMRTAPKTVEQKFPSKYLISKKTPEEYLEKCYMLGYCSRLATFNFYCDGDQQTFSSNQFVCFEEGHLFKLYSPPVNSVPEEEVTGIYPPLPAIEDENALYENNEEHQVSLQIPLQVETFNNVLEHMRKNPTVIGASYKLTELQKDVDRITFDEYNQMLKTCQDNRYIAYTPPQNLFKDDEDGFSGYIMPAADKLTIYKCKIAHWRTENIETIDIVNSSMFHAFSIALFGTGVYSDSLRVLLAREIVNNWSILEKACPILFNVPIAHIMRTAVTTELPGQEPSLLIFSLLLKRPIFVTNLTKTNKTRTPPTFHFLADTRDNLREPIYLVSLDGEYFARVPNSNNLKITEIDLKNTTNGIPNVIPQSNDNESLYERYKDSFGISIPVIHPPSWMNENLHKFAVDTIANINQRAANIDPDPAIAFQRKEESIQELIRLAGRMYKEIKIRSESESNKPRQKIVVETLKASCDKCRPPIQITEYTELYNKVNKQGEKLVNINNNLRDEVEKLRSEYDSTTKEFQKWSTAKNILDQEKKAWKHLEDKIPTTPTIIHHMFPELLLERFVPRLDMYFQQCIGKKVYFEFYIVTEADANFVATETPKEAEGYEWIIIYISVEDVSKFKKVKKDIKDKIEGHYFTQDWLYFLYFGSNYENEHGETTHQQDANDEDFVSVSGANSALVRNRSVVKLTPKPKSVRLDVKKVSKSKKQTDTKTKTKRKVEPKSKEPEYVDMLAQSDDDIMADESNAPLLLPYRTTMSNTQTVSLATSFIGLSEDESDEMTGGEPTKVPYPLESIPLGDDEELQLAFMGTRGLNPTNIAAKKRKHPKSSSSSSNEDESLKNKRNVRSKNDKAGDSPKDSINSQMDLDLEPPGEESNLQSPINNPKPNVG